MSKLAAKDVIFTLGLQRHPEGGWYAQTFEDESKADGRSRSTAIYYLLERGDVSAWHRVDAVEAWHFYTGAPLTLRVSDGITVDSFMLGPDLEAGQRPQMIVPRSAWQSAQSTGDWTLVGCTVAPGFRFSGFEMAAPGWEPGRD
ncbi:cupin domain-containing protein [Devosia neptuniae]|jgi:predicted cupin superfamily sugar epimerase|uniref:cupin domain-containing protein n=1 Tax=Devosia TaxID=46913 RepID=UPI0022AFCF99|nr:cupin domain-containing protein [Devosia neptuniae]MCZ4346099.1 cupin domain-containing protein [Devosia neptuniae]|tara:strand:+ start:123676 stop:124107 length:432 start_codon:yes stop_codon:yes gene_type:complete